MIPTRRLLTFTAQQVVGRRCHPTWVNPCSSRRYSTNDYKGKDHLLLGGPQKGDKVIVAMSGGVDSSVTALLMAQQDFDVRAVFMRNWSTLDESGSMQPGSGGSAGCEWQQDWNDVEQVCKHLGNLPVEMIDLSREYWINVFEPALADWSCGTTPNPDIDCNREIKFGALLDHLIDTTQQPKTWLATGHYADIRWMPQQAAPQPMLLRARDRSKDQTYYLSSVSQDRLRHSHFPLAGYLKSEIRQMAQTHQLPTANRKESMGICFIGHRGRGPHMFSSFLDEYISSEPGDIVNEHGEKVATHQGLHSLTIGQGARISGLLQKHYVARKNPLLNQIVVVQGSDHPMLQCRSLFTPSLHWIATDPPSDLPPIGSNQSLPLLAQIRHRQIETPCLVRRVETGYVVEFPSPIEAVAPGQTIALWKNDWCLGSGTIQTVTTVYDDQNSKS